MAGPKDKLNLTAERYEELRREAVKTVLDFFNTELAENILDSEQKESLLVAKQCFESCYEVDESVATDAHNLIEIMDKLSVHQPVEHSPELEASAEQFKVQGNDCMRDGDFIGAVDCYTKAINVYNKKAIYFCNRAAAFSRIDRHREAIEDCKEAIKLDPTYGKAYGRLGIAYSHLMMYKEAAESYRKALQLDPTNTTYEANLKLAEEKNQPAAAASATSFDFNSFMNNPALLNMASQMLNDPSFRNMGQQLAEHMQATNPGALSSLRETFMAQNGNGGGAGSTDEAGNSADNKEEEPKKE